MKVHFHFPLTQALVAQLVERFHGKEEVTGSIPVKGSISLQSETYIRKLTPMNARKPRRLCKNCQTPVKRFRDIYCDSTCQHEDYYNLYIQQWISGAVSGTIVGGVSGYIKRYLLKAFGERCSLCGWDERNPVTMKVPLEIDHIDGNYQNSALENLRLICPNCHALTPTFRGLNRGKGRGKKVNAPLA
jgi:hypothetical protein